MSCLPKSSRFSSAKVGRPTERSGVNLHSTTSNSLLIRKGHGAPEIERKSHAFLQEENLWQSRTGLVQRAVDAEDDVRALETDEEQQREELTWDDSTIKSH